MNDTTDYLNELFDGTLNDDWSQYSETVGEKLAEIYSLAKHQADEEEKVLWSESLSGAGVLNFGYNVIKGYDFGTYPDENSISDDVYRFRDEHCFDTRFLGESVFSIMDARDEIGDDIGETQDRISSGLSTWDRDKNETSEVFKKNYVDTITDRYANQAVALDHSGIALINVAALVNGNRDALDDVLASTKKALEDYDAFTAVTISAVDIGLQAAGLFVKPITGAVGMVATAGVQKLQTVLSKNGVGAAGMVEAMREAVTGALTDQSNEAFQSLAKEVHTQRSNESPKDHVLSCPQKLEYGK